MHEALRPHMHQPSAELAGGNALAVYLSADDGRVLVGEARAGAAATSRIRLLVGAGRVPDACTRDENGARVTDESDGFFRYFPPSDAFALALRDGGFTPDKAAVKREAKGTIWQKYSLTVCTWIIYTPPATIPIMSGQPKSLRNVLRGLVKASQPVLCCNVGRVAFPRVSGSGDAGQVPAAVRRCSTYG